MSLYVASLFLTAIFGESDCFEQDVNYSGHDIDNGRSADSAEHCQTMCQNFAGCSYWTWHADIAFCFKSGPNAVKESTEDETLWSGPKTCGVDPEPARWYLAPTDTSCDEACGLEGLQCSVQGLADHASEFDSREEMAAEITANGFYEPLESYSSNDPNTPYFDEGRCWYNAADRAPESFSCAAKPNTYSSRRICYCHGAPGVSTPSPTAQPSSTPTAVPTAILTEVPTANPTATPSAVPTAIPTASPTDDGRAPEATGEQTQSPTAQPTSTPTASLTDDDTTAPAGKHDSLEDIWNNPKKRLELILAVVLILVMVAFSAVLMYYKCKSRCGACDKYSHYEDYKQHYDEPSLSSVGVVPREHEDFKDMPQDSAAEYIAMPEDPEELSSSQPSKDSNKIVAEEDSTGMVLFTMHREESRRLRRMRVMWEHLKGEARN